MKSFAQLFIEITDAIQPELGYNALFFNMKRVKEGSNQSCYNLYYCISHDIINVTETALLGVLNEHEMAGSLWTFLSKKIIPGINHMLLNEDSKKKDKILSSLLKRLENITHE